jgi:hypothetical protein
LSPLGALVISPYRAFLKPPLEAVVVTSMKEGCRVENTAALYGNG